MTVRFHSPELLDLRLCPAEEAARSLADLRRHNRWLGGRRVLLRLLDAEVGRAGLRSFSLLDVGAGSGDLAAAAAQRFPAARVVLCDLKSHHLPGGAVRLAAAAEALPFRDGCFDFVAASLLLHHFRDEEAARVLHSLRRLARHAVLVNDLERHWFPLWFARATAPVFARSYLTRHDAPASVRQAFRPEELDRLARRAGFSRIVVRRHRPWFRVSLVGR